MEAQILALRKRERRGAVYLAGELGLVASTVGWVLARHQVPHLTAVDPITGEPVRRRNSGTRYERPVVVFVERAWRTSRAGAPSACPLP